MLQLVPPLRCRLHFLDSDPSCSVDAAAHDLSRLVRIESLCRMIRLGRPGRRVLFDELDTAAIDYLITCSDGPRTTRQAQPE